MLSLRASMAISIAVLLLVGCAKQGSQTSAPEGQPNQPQVSATNPTDFPLMDGATVLDVKPFQQTLSSDKMSGLMASGSGTYSGTEVLAGSTASMSDVDAWLLKTEQNPPTGYEYEPKTQLSTLAPALGRYGIEYAVFKRTDPASKRGVVVVAMDPARVHDKLGFALGLLDKYRMLPDSMKTRIDEEMKSRSGFSVNEATDPSAPLGLTVAAIKQIHSGNERAIVLLDASKQ